MIQKSYSKKESGTFYLVPTPIGNLEDITLRAINTLKNSDVIYAEDTRVTNNLLKHFDICKKVLSCHKYTENMHKDKILKEVISGKNVSFVSDRGTPMISDPGNYVVDYLIKNNVNVVSLPGASALLPALNMSGLSNDKFLFYGFLSSNKSEVVNELKKLRNFDYSIVFYESPHRIKSTIEKIVKIFGNRKLAIVREISKLHEEVFRGTGVEAIEYCDTIKGEIVIIVDGNNDKIEDIDYKKEVEKLLLDGYSKSSAVKEISNLYGISKNKLYEECKEI